MLVLAGLFMPASITGSVGWALAVLGLAGSGAAAFGKVMLERSNAQQLDACQKQLGVLQLQVQQAKDDRDALDAQLAARRRADRQPAASGREGSGGVGGVDAVGHAPQRGPARGRTPPRAASAEAEEELKTARRRWREALAAAGLAREDRRPKQVRRLMQRGDRIAEMQRRLAAAARRACPAAAGTGSLWRRGSLQLAADAGVSLGAAESGRATARSLPRRRRGRRPAVARRDAIRREARRIRVARAKHEEAIGRLKHRRRELFLEAGVKDEQEFRQRALECARADVLRREREAIAREIEAALASQCSEDAIRQQLEGEQAVPLESAPRRAAPAAWRPSSSNSAACWRSEAA